MIRCGIILHPAGHTLSPVLHAEAYAALDLDARYEVFDIQAADLEPSLQRLRSKGLRQLSVSLPHKETVLALATKVSDQAKQIGAANTLTFIDDEIVADNTDWIGVLRTLEPLGPWAGKNATILGAGGAARAVAYALTRLSLNVTIVNRTPERAAEVAHDLGVQVGELRSNCDLLINATSVGMQPDIHDVPCDVAILQPSCVVFDSVYRPLETALLRNAREHGCRVQDGLDMLVHQAVEQVRIWSGRTPEAKRLRRAAEDAL